MTSLITKEEFRIKLIKFIDQQDVKDLGEFKEILQDKKFCTEVHPSSPKKPNLDNIAATGERAYQRGIVNEKFTLLDDKKDTPLEKVTWLDLELPVVLGKSPRRMSIDLIGSLDGIPVLCELKYNERSNSDHPIYAIVELLTYRYFIQCNYEKLDEYDVHHHLVIEDFKWSVIAKNPFPKLIIAANKKYWDYWFTKMKKSDLVRQTFNLGCELDTNIHLFESVDEDYIKQKGNSSHYRPTISSNVWTKIR